MPVLESRCVKWVERAENAPEMLSQADASIEARRTRRRLSECPTARVPNTICMQCRMDIGCAGAAERARLSLRTPQTRRRLVSREMRRGYSPAVRGRQGICTESSNAWQEGEARAVGDRLQSRLPYATARGSRFEFWVRSRRVPDRAFDRVETTEERVLVWGRVKHTQAHIALRMLSHREQEESEAEGPESKHDSIACMPIPRSPP
ncbi:hypothetical protein C8T65DRAFT_225544 [Cerioporus squamosus]|nr:hypothetical protein C8T65DRAFT_225544 [Cerioporus squamosus]